MNFFRGYAQFGHELTKRLKKILQNNPSKKVRELLPFSEFDCIPLDIIPETLSQSLLFLELYHTVAKPLPTLFSQKNLSQWNAHPLFRDDAILQKILISIARYLALVEHQKLFESWQQLSRINFLQRTYPPFISYYRKAQQKKHGIIYTPEAVTNFIVRACDLLLREQLHLSEGFQTPTVFVYDPAVGSLSFELELSNMISTPALEQFWTRVYGNELNIPAYCIGRFLVTDELIEKGIPIKKGKNTLQIEFESALTPHFLKKFQSKHVGNDNALVIIGNPPYSVSSSNKTPWITTLMKEYAVAAPNLTRLYDDYVKFIRYGQWLLDQQGRGILAYITNRKFLDGKIFHGMRQSLLHSFSDIWIIDLHGDQRNVKNAAIHTPQANIFGIQTGICILLCVKQSQKKSESGSLHYTSFTGERPHILKKLSQPISSISFETWVPAQPQCMFIPIHLSKKLTQLWDQRGIPITECFHKTSRAMISSRDRFMVHVDEDVLRNNIQLLKSRDFSQLRQQRRLKNAPDALLENAEVLDTFDFEAMRLSVTPILYRPFDYRFGIFYTINRRCGKSVILNYLAPKTKKQEKFDHSKEFYNSAIQSSQVAFNFIQSIQFPPFCHCLLSKGIVDSGLFGYSTSKVAPLWIEEKCNLHPTFLLQIQEIIPEVSPADIFGYIYAMLNSQEYARMYEPRLLHEFPRVILPSTGDEFSQLASLGLQLMDFHVRPDVKQVFKGWCAPLRSWTFDVTEENLQLTFARDKTQEKSEVLVFSCPQSVWTFRYGSIQVIKHWLQARVFKKLERAWSNQEWKGISALLCIIPRTLSLQGEIDTIFSQYFSV